MDPKFQLSTLRALTFIAFLILALAASTFYMAMTADTPKGTIPVGESSAFMALMLSFREVLGAIKGLANIQREQIRDQQIFESKPAAGTPPVDPSVPPAGED